MHKHVRFQRSDTVQVGVVDVVLVTGYEQLHCLFIAQLVLESAVEVVDQQLSSRQ